jgi:hypothetical protein
VAFDNLNYALYESSIVDKSATSIAQLLHQLNLAVKDKSNFCIRFPILTRRGRTGKTTRISLKEPRTEFLTKNLRTLKFYLVRNHTPQEIEQQLNIPNQQTLKETCALIFLGDDESAFEDFAAVTDGAEYLDWEDDIEPTLLPLPVKTRTKSSASRPKTQRVYHLYNHQGSYDAYLTDDRKQMLEAMTSFDHAVFTHAKKRYFDPQCTLPIENLSDYLNLRNTWAAHAGLHPITTVLYIPKLMTHKPYTAQSILDIQHVVELALKHPDLQDLWELYALEQSHAGIAQTLFSLHNRTYDDLMTDMTAALGPNPLTELWNEHHNRVFEFFRLVKAIHVLNGYFPTLFDSISNSPPQGAKIVKDIQTIYTTYQDLFDSLQTRYPEISFNHRKHYLQLVHNQLTHQEA